MGRVGKENPFMSWPKLTFMARFFHSHFLHRHVNIAMIVFKHLRVSLRRPISEAKVSSSKQPTKQHGIKRKLTRSFCLCVSFSFVDKINHVGYGEASEDVRGCRRSTGPSPTRFPHPRFLRAGLHLLPRPSQNAQTR